MTLLRLICILTGGHSGIVQDDWHDGTPKLEQCWKCCEWTSRGRWR
jgi:hypothetical protein